MMKKILIVATSLDGYIARRRDQVSTAWTSAADRKWFGQISRQAGVLIMGAPTYATIGRALPDRQIIVMGEASDNQDLPGVEEFVVGGAGVYRSHGRTPEQICDLLTAKGLSQVAICGGARIYQSFLAAGLVDELFVTIEPVFLGDGIKLTAGDWCDGVYRLEVIEKIALDEQTSVWHLKKIENCQHK